MSSFRVCCLLNDDNGGHWETIGQKTGWTDEYRRILVTTL
jgi:hypothetical protein